MLIRSGPTAVDVASTSARIVLVIGICALVGTLVDRLRRTRETDEEISRALELHLYAGEFRLDDRYRETYTGPGVERILGRPLRPGERPEDAWDAAVHPDDRAAFEEFFSADGLSSQEFSELEYRVVGNDGSARWVLDRVHATHERGRHGADQRPVPRHHRAQARRRGAARRARAADAPRRGRRRRVLRARAHRRRRSACTPRQPRYRTAARRAARARRARGLARRRARGRPARAAGAHRAHAGRRVDRDRVPHGGEGRDRAERLVPRVPAPRSGRATAARRGALRHHRAHAHGGGARGRARRGRAAGADRRADPARQPRASQRHPRRTPRASRHRHLHRSAAARRRPLQAHQRHARPPGGRRGADRARAAPHGDRRRARARRASRRRGARRARDRSAPRARAARARARRCAPGWGTRR